jgi:hypothetical protein
MDAFVSGIHLSAFPLPDGRLPGKAVPHCYLTPQSMSVECWTLLVLLKCTLYLALLTMLVFILEQTEPPDYHNC